MAAQESRLTLSVVVVSFSSAALLAQCLTSLVEQADADDEIVVVRASGRDDAAIDELQARFGRCRWLIAPVAESVPRLRRMGMLGAIGDVVALVEDDCLVDRSWCAAVRQLHRQPWAAVGGAVEPGAYARARDWAVYFYEYGRFMLPFEARASSVLPGNNVSYKRAVLADGALADTVGFYDVAVHEAWRRNGRPMLMSPAMVVTNRNSWPRSHLSVAAFHHGRGFAARRVAGYSWARRAAFALGTPLLPVVQIVRIARLALAKRRLLGRLTMAVPWLLVFGGSWAAGECAGYLLGAGASARHWR